MRSNTGLTASIIKKLTVIEQKIVTFIVHRACALSCQEIANELDLNWATVHRRLDGLVVLGILGKRKPDNNQRVGLYYSNLTSNVTEQVVKT